MIDWDKATYEALQEDMPRTAAIISDEVYERISHLEEENSDLKESLEDVKAMFRAEDKGWALISGITAKERLEGLELEEAQSISEAIRPHVVADGLVKRGADLHSGYVWSKGINIDGVKSTGKQGRPSSLVTFYKNPVNQESLFSDMAHEELQKARFADGNILLACDTSDKTVRRIPFNQITDIRVNPDFPEEVWAYQRTWHPDRGINTKPKTRWYYTNRYSGPKQKSFTVNNVTTPVETGVVIVDRRFNRQIGYALGIPDAIGMMVWVAAYTEIIQYGRVVNESLARILYKVISKTKNGVTSSGVKIAGMGGHGNTASMMEGQDIQAVSTAGKGYDFVSARPVGSMAAAAINVSIVELLADSSAAGSSYGAAQTLTPSTKNAMRLMQGEWASMYQEIFSLFRLGEPRVWFEPLEDVDVYRSSQALKLNGTHLSDEEIRGKALDLMDIAGNPEELPDKVKIANDLAKAGADAAAAQAAAPDQGVSNGSGGGGQGANDQRSDAQSEGLRREMAMTEMIEHFEALVQRAEAVSQPS